MKTKSIVGRILERESMKKIIGGLNFISSCSVDCGAGVKVSCSGSSCTTTDYGCYAQNSNGGIDFSLCPHNN